MVDDVAGCEALVCALLSVEPDIPNADDLILRAAVAVMYLAQHPSLRCETVDASTIVLKHASDGMHTPASLNATMKFPYAVLPASARLQLRPMVLVFGHCRSAADVDSHCYHYDESTQ